MTSNNAYGIMISMIRSNNNNKEKKMIKKMFYSALGSETLIIAGCIAMIIAGSIFGAWALLQTI